VTKAISVNTAPTLICHRCMPRGRTHAPLQTPSLLIYGLSKRTQVESWRGDDGRELWVRKGRPRTTFKSVSIV